MGQPLELIFDYTHLLSKVNFFISLSCGAGLSGDLLRFFEKKHLDCKQNHIFFLHLNQEYKTDS